MNRTLKTFLLWLLISALPMQAFAVAIAAACKPAHAMSGQTMAENSMSGHAMDGHAIAEHIADAPQNVDPQRADQQHATSYVYNCDCADDESCSACAACCAASSAAVTAAPAPALHPMPESFTARLNALGDGFISAILERPPKQA